MRDQSWMRRQQLFGIFIFALSLCACTAKPARHEMSEAHDEVRKAVQPHLPEVRKCYEDALIETPMLEGKLVLEWIYDEAGQVVEAKVQKADPRIEPVVPCVLERVRTWHFPPAPKGDRAYVTYPFFFSENGKKPQDLK